MKQVIATICSREKRQNKGLLTADLRYLGKHVSLVKEKAEEEGMEFYILSGLYGLISAEAKIPFYDYFLEEKTVDSLVEKMEVQIKENNIFEIKFFTKSKWKTYNRAMEKVCSKLGITLLKEEIEEN